MIKVYVCSPFRDNKLHTQKENVDNAIKYSKQIIKQGNMPITPHLMYPQVLDDLNASERKKGISFDLELINFCDVLCVCGNLISDGMQKEIRYAQQLNKTIMFL